GSYTAQGPIGGGIPAETNLSPEQSKALTTIDAAIRWPGRLTLVPTCEAAGRYLPAMLVRVAVPGPAPSGPGALARALSVSGGLFSRCRPPADGDWKVGSIQAPDHSVAPMTARCSAVIQEEPGFVVVALRFVAPAAGPGLAFPKYLQGFMLPGRGALEIARWTFVVLPGDVR